MMTKPKTLLRQLKKNLNTLREREAKYGRDAPLELLNQIEDHHKAIALTEQVLAGELSEPAWQEALQPLLLAVQSGQVVKIEAETYIAGPVQGDVVRRDKVQGDKIGRDKISHTQINIGLSEIVTPDRAAIAGYLEQLIQDTRARQQSESQPQSAALQRLWQQTFYVRRPGQTALSRRSLDQAIQDRLDLKRPAGIVRRAVALLADAGVGKTPAFQHILLKVAEKSLPYYQLPSESTEQENYTLVPILIRLAELRPGQQLLTLVRTAYNRHAAEAISLDQAEKLLETYPCLLMIDDLDKVAFSAQQGGIQLIREFMDNYPQERYVISCRTSGYHEQLGPMDAFILDELTEEQVRAVLAEAFDARLLPLARNRAMLQILLTGGPRAGERWSRGRLVQRMVGNQLRVSHKDEAGLDLEMIEALLEQLGYHMHQARLYHQTEQQLMTFMTDHLTAWHEPYSWRQVIRFLRQIGVLVQDDLRQFRFCNRSTQAYFVAAAIYKDQRLVAGLLQNASDFWWREPLEILVGLLDDPSELLFDMIDHDALATAHCLQFVGQPVEQRVFNTLVDALVEQMRHERAAGRERLVRLLTEIGQSPPQELFWQLLYRERKSLVILVIAQALANPNHISKSRATAVYGAEVDETEINPNLKEIIDLWQAHGRTTDNQGKDEIEQTLMARLRQRRRQQEGLVSGLAAIALGFIGIDPDRDQARQMLLAELQANHQNQFITWCTVEALSQIKHQEVEQAAIALYRRPGRRGSQRREWQRIHAVYLLGAVGGRFGETVEILNEALAEPNPTLRGYAARSVGRLGLLKAREQLESGLESKDAQRREQNPWALRRIVEALGKVGTLESIPVLEPYLRHEEIRTRRRVREAITEIRRRYELA